MQLNSLKNSFGAKHKRKRICRGPGSGKGKTGGRGTKGQKARSGVSIRWFEGGQMPIIARLPKRGFRSKSKIKYKILNIADITYLIKENKLSGLVTNEQLVKFGILKNLNQKVKLLARGEEINSKVTVKFDRYSVKAKTMIEQAGGEVL